jgi:hypothetical protein
MQTPSATTRLTGVEQMNGGMSAISRVVIKNTLQVAQ